MPKIVYPICCGIDVHKSFVVACVATTDKTLVTTYKSKRFSTFTGDLRRLSDWLTQNHCQDVCMESTGKYWIPVWNILEPTCRLVLTHPKYVKAIKGKKTDKRDAKWIADVFKHDMLNGSFIPLNCQVKCNTMPKKTSKGESQCKHLRGRKLSFLTESAISTSEQEEKSKDFGKYSLIKPLVFSFVPRCQGACGLGK